ncbi:MAG: thrombospondin type 3 repeat-containing protein [Myxococcota bacterium]|nr:thrombospondin type 3 repeat-containing protein [Myxococcota bacterium]
MAIEPPDLAAPEAGADVSGLPCRPGEELSCLFPAPGECSRGVRECHSGAWSGCLRQVFPAREMCNGLDDDCDGRTDEEMHGLGCVLCGIDRGDCRYGGFYCRDGQVVCEDAIGGHEEECNGRDDDCDGERDEGWPDADGDRVGDPCDNCPEIDNGDQSDCDGDGVGNACDNCPFLSNPGQADPDGDGLGEACDPDCEGDPVECAEDPDEDGVLLGDDNCPRDFNPGQEDADWDGVGDVCDSCPVDPNPDQTDTDCDGIGDACAKQWCVPRGTGTEICNGMDDDCNGMVDDVPVELPFPVCEVGRLVCP